jgi:hypothetical protein
MAELVADPLESEERTRALQCVLRLGQMTLFERAEEGVVLRRSERRQELRRGRHGRSRPRAAGEEKDQSEFEDAHERVAAGPRDDGRARLYP